MACFLVWCFGRNSHHHETQNTIYGSQTLINSNNSLIVTAKPTKNTVEDYSPVLLDDPRILLKMV